VFSSATASLRIPWENVRSQKNKFIIHLKRAKPQQIEADQAHGLRPGCFPLLRQQVLHAL
jgi:hypothetical protein